MSKEEAAQRTMAAISDVKLNGLESRLPFQLSGGQQQRVALGRALVSRPEIMLLDEPLSNLDANLREEMRFEIKELQRHSGVTILYVTHDQEVALAISDRMAIIDNNGSIRQVGAPDEIHENPVDSFVFKFLGISNFIPVTYRDGGAYIDDSKTVLDYPIPEDRITELRDDKMIAGCRPYDIKLVRDGAATKGVIKRMAYLGPIVDYRIESGGKEIRVQQDIQDVHDEERSGLIFQEGDVVGMKFLELRWFKSHDVEQERS